MKARYFFLVLFLLILGARLCHVQILWAEENLALAAAKQIEFGKVLYRDAWFDKPPGWAWIYLLWGANAGWGLRLAGALYSLLVCWLFYRFARGLWSESEGLWAGGLAAFFLVFDTPSSVTPLAVDLLMLAPHLAAVCLAWKGRAFWSGIVCGLAFLINAKAVFVLALCAFFCWRSVVMVGLGFLLPNLVALGWLWWQGALVPYYEQVWKWGFVYAGKTFVANPWRNGFVRTLNWTGFHSALVLAALWFWHKDRESGLMRFLLWAGVSLVAVSAGLRFFSRYYFQLLPVFLLAASRGLVLLGRRKVLVLALLTIPLVRFGPRYALLARDLAAGAPHRWADVAMDQDSRAAAAVVSRFANAGDTLFVWGYRPEFYVYTGLKAGTRFLDSQPLTGVPADRHLTHSETLAAELGRVHRRELSGTQPTFVLDGLGLYNPRLAIGAYEDLRTWLGQYKEVGRSGHTIVYRLRPR